METITTCDLKRQQQVINTFINEFKKHDGLSKKRKALSMLRSLFDKMNFDFSSFHRQLRLSELQTDRWVSYLYYGIYYLEIPLANYWKKPHLLNHFLLCLLAETLSEKKLTQILKQLKQKEQLQLITYCSLHLREGAWTILQIFEAIFKENEEWKIFLKRVKNKYYDLSETQKFVDILPSQSSTSLSSLIKILDQTAVTTVESIAQHLPILVNEIIHSPLEGFNILEKEKKMLGMGNLGFDLSETMREKAEAAKEKLNLLFAPYLKQSYTSEELQEFFQLFGLKGFFFNTPAVQNPEEPLYDMLRDISQFVRFPNASTKDYIQSVVSFVLSLCQQLYAFHREPGVYANGLGKIVYTVATRGCNFKTLQWLPSVLNSLETLYQHLKKKGELSFQLSKYPIIIFDQAPAQEWKKNHALILELEKEYQACIWHLSNKHTLALAKKLNVGHWIKVTDDGLFGYAGSRNCTLLLAPVIYKAAQGGKKNIRALLRTRKTELATLFDQFILGGKGEDLLIHTGEDDAAFPSCQLFSDTLFACQHSHDYLQRPMYCVGRQTYDLKYYLGLKTLLKYPYLAFQSTRWSSIPLPGGMKGLLTKPKFCLPFPFGNEECHVMAQKTYYDPFHQPLLHLSGNRFPRKLYPTSPFDGLIETLKKHIPYVLQTIMTEDLIDHIRIDAHHGILPWNDKELKKARPFRSLDDLWKYANSPETIGEIKKRFWKNFEIAFQKSPPKGYMFAKGIKSLMKIPVCPEIPNKLLEFYEELKFDAHLLLNYVREIKKLRKRLGSSAEEIPFSLDLKEIQERLENCHKIKFTQTKLTKGLQLILEWINSIKGESIRHNVKPER